MKAFNNQWPRISWATADLQLKQVRATGLLPPNNEYVVQCGDLHEYNAAVSLVQTMFLEGKLQYWEPDPEGLAVMYQYK